MKIVCRHLFVFLVFTVSASALVLSVTCSKKSPTKPEEKQSFSETPELRMLSDSLIVAFKNQDREKILGFINDEYRETYSEMLNRPELNLVAFGSALQKRKLIFTGPLYAEYAVTVEGQAFSVAYAQCGDNNWQLVGF